MLRLFFGLPWWMFVVLGALSLPLALYLYLEMNRQAADYEAALVQGPPDLVTISEFDRDTHAGLLGEVVIRAQLDLGMRYELIRKKKGSVRDRAFMIPLYAVDAKDTSQPPIGLLWETDDAIDPEVLIKTLVGEGPLGPIMDLHGSLAHMGSLSSNAEDAFKEQSRAWSSAASKIVIDPFQKDRAVEMERPGGSVELFLVLCGIGAVLIAIGLFKKGSYRRQLA
ncbi:MAG: hypothetical protein AAF367_15890 [Pseudomonadota bacterium]